jgi:regulator of protease activity HflC (stomatin/prohibitin superfamily)
MESNATLDPIATRVVRFGFRVTVPAWSTAVIFRDGVRLGERGPGRHWRARRSDWHIVDIRPGILNIPSQEVLTSDGVQVRLSMRATVTVVDATAWFAASAAPAELLYSELQIALRDRVAATELADIAASRSTLLEGVDTELAPIAATVGAQLSAVALKDITLPQEVRAALANVALTKQRGLAELERARAESASLRSLANSSKLLIDNPALLQLRTLQAASEGATVIIHRGDSNEGR